MSKASRSRSLQKLGINMFSKKLLLLLVAIVSMSSMGSAAAVNLVTAIDNDELTTFIDVDSIKSINKSNMIFKTIENFRRKVVANQAGSIVEIWKINCKTRRLQVLEVISYSEIYGGGVKLNDNVGGLPGFGGMPGLTFEEFSIDELHRNFYAYTCK